MAIENGIRQIGTTGNPELVDFASHNGNDLVIHELAKVAAAEQRVLDSLPPKTEFEVGLAIDPASGGVVGDGLPHDGRLIGGPRRGNALSPLAHRESPNYIDLEGGGEEGIAAVGPDKPDIGPESGAQAQLEMRMVAPGVYVTVAPTLDKTPEQLEKERIESKRKAQESEARRRDKAKRRPAEMARRLPPPRKGR